MCSEQDIRAATPAVALLCLVAGLGHAIPAQGQETEWRVVVGGGVFSAPTFPGSDSQRTRVLPLIGASFANGRFFIFSEPGAGTLTGVGYNFYRGPNLRLSAGIGAGLTRRQESDDPRLTGLGDVDRTATAQLGASYTLDWFVARARVATDIGGNEQGTLARLDLLGHFRPGDRWALAAGPGLEWANDRYMQTFFGVDATQSANSGLPQFSASSGIVRTRLSANAIYTMSRNWGVGASGWIARLQNDAATSPITEDKSQHYVGIFVIYRFGSSRDRLDALDLP